MSLRIPFDDIESVETQHSSGRALVVVLLKSGASAAFEVLGSGPIDVRETLDAGSSISSHLQSKRSDSGLPAP